MKFTEAMAYLLRCQKMQEIVLNFSVEEKLLSAEGLLKIRMAMTPKKGGSNPYHPLVLLGNKEYQPVEVSPSAMFSALRNSQSSLPSLNITV